MKCGDCSNPKHPSHCCESLISDHRAMPPIRKPLPSLKRKLVPLSRSSTPSGSAQAGSGARVGVGSKAKPQDTYLYQAGIQDVSGRVPEFFVSVRLVLYGRRLIAVTERRRQVSSMRDRSLLSTENPSPGIAMLSQNVRLRSCS